jgi:hypothetical protein
MGTEENGTTIYVGMISWEKGEDFYVTRVLRVTEESMKNIDHPAWFHLELIEWANEQVVMVSWTKGDGDFSKAPSRRQELLGVNDPEVEIHIPVYDYLFNLRSFHSEAKALEWNRTRTLQLQQEFEGQINE